MIVLNGTVGALGTPEAGTVEDALSAGLQVAAWVALWFPINLLVYDRWYYVRDRAGLHRAARPAAQGSAESCGGRNAFRPVISRPTMSALTRFVPS